MAVQGAKKATKVEIQEKLRSLGVKVTGSEEELEKRDMVKIKYYKLT